MLLVENSFRSVILGGLLSLSACASTPLVEGQLPGAVADDAVEFNESFARATDAEVLKNILRAKDRWPRTYSSMTEVSSDRSVQTQAQLGFEFPFSALKDGNSTPQITQTFGSEPTTTYKPQNSQEFTWAMFTPIPVRLFRHYWNSGWPKDVLLLMLGDSIQKDGGLRHFNSAKEIDGCGIKLREESESGFPGEGSYEGPCAYILTVHYLLKATDPETIDQRLKLSFSEKSKKNGAKESSEEEYDNCKPIGSELSDKNEASLKTIAALAEVLKKAGEYVTYSSKHDRLCIERSKFKVWITDRDNHKTYELSLRSLDSMIYYLGEIARLSHPPKIALPPDEYPAKAHPAAVPAKDSQEAGKTIDRPEESQGNTDSENPTFEYLFRVTKNKPCGRYYAASVVHNGTRYYAGPPAKAHATEQDSGDGCANDRTATVLTLLDQVRALNQKAEMLRGPTNVNVVGGKL